MEISKTLIEQIAKTLPIGLYAGRRIPITIEENTPCSSYNPTQDEIGVSLEQIQNSFKSVDENMGETEIEELIRSNLYHEVSHAILTPKDLRPNNAINIFEDERIERNLADFYYNIDFVKDKYLMNGIKDVNDIPTPTNAEQAFYNVCRFQSAPKKLIDEFMELYKKYKDINRNTDNNNIWHYPYDIKNFYDKVAKAFNTNPEQFGQGGENKMQITQDIQNGSGNSEKPLNKGNEDTEEMGNGNGNEDSKGNIDGEEKFSKDFGRNGGMLDVFHSVLSYDRNSSYYNTFEQIISVFDKRNNSGSSISGYSGRINPRLVANNDFRYFERKSTVQGNNAYGSLHLNLFIDCSGSYYKSEHVTNQIITALADLEKKYDYFTFDLVCCSVGQKIMGKNKRYVKADGGNHLTDEIREQIKLLQKPNTMNYNIVLFDGECSPQDRKTTFKNFDKPNFSLIIEQDNQKYTQGFTSAKVTIENTNYTDKLFENVCKALKIAFR